MRIQSLYQLATQYKLDYLAWIDVYLHGMNNEEASAVQRAISAGYIYRLSIDMRFTKCIENELTLSYNAALKDLLRLDEKRKQEAA